MPGFLQTHL